MSRRKRLKKFENFAGAPVKPIVKPGVKPDVDPGRRHSPTRKDKPGVDPAPKGTLTQVVNRFVDILLKQPLKIKKEFLELAKKPGIAQPTIKPGVKPDVDPGRRHSPTRKDKPGVDPAPKGQYESRILDWKTFEASLEENPGVPDEILRRAEQEGDEAVQQQGITQRTGMELMQLSGEAMQLQRPHKKALEDIVHDAVTALYGEFLDGVDLDVKIVEPGEPNEMMEQEEDEDETPMEEIEDEDLKNKIHARKLANTLVQGESKNIFRIIEMPEFRVAIEELDPRLYEIYKRIAEINENFHWVIPMEVQAQMWKEHPEGQAGAVKVEYKDQGEKEEKAAEDILAELEKGFTLDEVEPPEDDIYGSIKAVGIDVPVLLHEAIKGILELISAHTIPDDEETAKTVMFNVESIDNEIEDLRYGPTIAAKLRDVINSAPNADYNPNIRFYVWGYLMRLDAAEMLDKMRGLLSDDAEAIQWAHGIVDDIVKDFKDYEVGSALGDVGQPEEFAGLEEPEAPGGVPTEDETHQKGFEDMSQTEIQALIDQALEDGDFETVKNLSKYLT